MNRSDVTNTDCGVYLVISISKSKLSYNQNLKHYFVVFVGICM